MTSEVRKKFLLTAGLRALVGLVVFGGFCFSIAPFTIVPITARDVLMIVAVGIFYATSYRLRIMLPRLAAVVLLALSIRHLLQLPAALWILVPMTLAGLGMEYLLPYPKKREERDGKPDDVRPPAP